MGKTKSGNFNQAMFEMFGVGKDQQVKEADVKVREVSEKPPVFSEAKKPDVKLDEAEKKEMVEKTEKAVFKPQEEIMQTTHISEGTVFEGNLRSKGNLVLAGEFHGDINAKGSVAAESLIEGNIKAGSVKLTGSECTGNISVAGTFIADAEATVTGDVMAAEAVISGKVKGKIIVSGNLTLESTAVIEGDIKTGTMVMACGAIVKGGIEMDGNVKA